MNQPGLRLVKRATIWTTSVLAYPLAFALLGSVGGQIRAADSASAARSESASNETQEILETLSPGSLGAPELAERRAAGETLFFDNGCWRCHALGDEALPGTQDFLNLGPDLETLRGRRSLEHVVESIVDPNARIAAPRDDHLGPDGGSRMPAFHESLDAASMIDLALFLSVQERRDRRNRPGPPSLAVEIPEEVFEPEALESEQLVLLDFWSETCIPCLALEPILDKLSLEFAGEVKILRINTYSEPDLTAEYVPDLILPCLILLRDGEVIERRFGTDPEEPPESFMRDWLKSVLDPNETTER